MCLPPKAVPPAQPPLAMPMLMCDSSQHCEPGVLLVQPPTQSLSVHDRFSPFRSPSSSCGCPCSPAEAAPQP